MSARVKRLVLKAWVRFLKNGLQGKDFSDRLYRHLINHCSFIAHYDRAGFYATHFGSDGDSLEFLSQFDMRGHRQWVEYKLACWLPGACEDLKRAMIEEASPYVPALIDRFSAKARKAYLAEVRRLAAKHGFKIQ